MYAVLDQKRLVVSQNVYGRNHKPQNQRIKSLQDNIIEKEALYSDRSQNQLPGSFHRRSDEGWLAVGRQWLVLHERQRNHADWLGDRWRSLVLLAAFRRHGNRLDK